MRKKFVINFITFLLVIIAGVSIVWPEISKILENGKNLEDINGKLTVLSQKSQKIEQLSQELSQNPKNQETILEYIPIKKSEDFLINYLNGIASPEGIGVRNIILTETNSNNLIPQVALEGSQASLDGTGSFSMSPRPVFLTTRFNFFSSYEKINSVLKKFDGLKRFNRATYLKITKTYPENNEEDATLNFLQVEIGLDFNYLKKIASRSEVGEEVFGKEGLDAEVLKNIEAKAINDVTDPDGKSDGRNNPFIP